MNSFIITSHLRSSFRGIGAYVRAVPLPPPRRTWNGFATETRRINVRNDAFELMLPLNARAVVLDCRKDEHHLVLSVQEPRVAPQRFLCGFDERHWFAAAVTGHTVAKARESLMPPAVREAGLRAGIRHADFFRRHTKAFIRQGEWFFVPEEIEADPLLIRRREPLIRPGGGKAHIVDELVRGQGEMVWHHARLAPNGITDAEFEKQTEWSRKSEGWSRRMRISRDVAVHARGAVRHPDHATVYLVGWHRVYINSEVRPASLGFLD